MLPLVLALSLCAAPSAPITLAAPAFSYANVDDKTGDFFLDALGQQLIKQGAQVITQKEIAAVMGLERQRQLVGCGDDAEACVAELGGALGADGIITGSLARTSAGFAINLKVIASGSGKTLSAESVRVKTDDALLDWFEEAAVRMVKDLRAALGREGRKEPRPEPEEVKKPAPTQPERSEKPSEPLPPPAAATHEVLWNGRWYPARVVKVGADGKSLIHYEGYSDAWDEWVSEARIRALPGATPKKPAPMKAPKIGAALEVEWNGKWFPAKVIEVREDGHAYIRYDGYGDHWNEWVGPERMRPPQ